MERPSDAQLAIDWTRYMRFTYAIRDCLLREVVTSNCLTVDELTASGLVVEEESTASRLVVEVESTASSLVVEVESTASEAPVSLFCLVKVGFAVDLTDRPTVVGDSTAGQLLSVVIYPWWLDDNYFLLFGFFWEEAIDFFEGLMFE